MPRGLVSIATGTRVGQGQALATGCAVSAAIVGRVTCVRAAVAARNGEGLATKRSTVTTQPRSYGNGKGAVERLYGSNGHADAAGTVSTVGGSRAQGTAETRGTSWIPRQKQRAEREGSTTFNAGRTTI